MQIVQKPAVSRKLVHIFKHNTWNEKNNLSETPVWGK